MKHAFLDQIILKMQTCLAVASTHPIAEPICVHKTLPEDKQILTILIRRMPTYINDYLHVHHVVKQ